MGVSAKCCQTERSRLIYEQAVVLEQGRSCYKNASKYLDVEDLGDNVAVVVESYDKNKANAWRRPATIQREAPANRPSYSGPMCVTVMRIWEYVTRVGRRARLSTEFLRSHWMCRPPMGRSGTRVETKQEKKTKTNKEQRKQARKKWPSCADNPMTRAERKLYPGGNTLVALPIHLAFSLQMEYK